MQRGRDAVLIAHGNRFILASRARELLLIVVLFFWGWGSQEGCARGVPLLFFFFLWYSSRMEEEQTVFTEAPTDDDVLASWKFLEFEKPERGMRWYFFATIVAGLLLLYSILTHNYIFGVIIILVALIYFLYDLHDAPETSLSITTAGIEVGRKFIKYRDIVNFWIIYKPGVTTSLYFKPRVFAIPLLSIPLMDQDPLQIREILLQYLPENLTEEDEPLSETMGKILKL